MKKFTSLLITVLLMVFAFGQYVDAAQKRFTAQVYRYNGNKIALTAKPTEGSLALTGITYKVLAINSNTAETLLASRGLSGRAITSKTNPVTSTVFATDGRIDFVCDPTDTADDTYVDLIVTDTVGGYTAFVENFSPNMHTIVIDETPGVMHHGMIWFTADSTSATAELTTGVYFLKDTFIHDVWVEVVTVSSGLTIDVGLLSSETSGDANGLRAGVLLTTAGYIKETGVITGGTTIDYYPASTYGALLKTAITGSDTVATVGGNTYIGHVVTSTNAKTISFTASSNAGTNPDGFIHYFFSRLR